MCLFCIVTKLSEKVAFSPNYSICWVGTICKVTKLSGKVAFSPIFSICWVPYVIILSSQLSRQLQQVAYFVWSRNLHLYFICIIICMSDKDGFSPILYDEYDICLFYIVTNLSEKAAFTPISYAGYHICLFCIVKKLSEKAEFSLSYSICWVPCLLIL